MEAPVKQQLLDTLQDLGEEELKVFQWYLPDAELLDGFSAIKKCHLENAGRLKTVDLMVNMYTSKDVMQVAKLILKKRNERKRSQVGPQDSSARAASAAGALDKCQPKLKSNLKKKFQCVFEGIAKAGNPALLNQIYTEL
ncbi:NACHT, LRR and PYD domains-containing protein 6-like [Trachinotus anak]|uniref:NACHT, LRR and PYD domains-containing protein 6-like n=1 Tax=Trachinotus anak TaxID=443729 RepID=UPI0039F25F32